MSSTRTHSGPVSAGAATLAALALLLTDCLSLPQCALQRTGCEDAVVPDPWVEQSAACETVGSAFSVGHA